MIAFRCKNTKGEIFYYIQQKLKKQELKDIINESQNVNDETVDALLDFILTKFKPKGFKEGDQPVHDLSKEGIGRVNAMVSSIDDFDVEAMVKLVENRKTAAEKTMEINHILKNAMTDEDAGKFAEKENALLKKKDETSSKIHESEMRLTNMKDELTIAIQQRDRAFQTIKDNAQNKHVFELSTGLSQMMEAMLSAKSESIKRKLEKLIVENLQHIYRKNNLITHIEIEDDFQFNLYQNVRYSTTELLHLIRNLGKDVFASEIGKQGMKALYKKYKVDSVQALQQALDSDENKNTHKLYKRIDISRLSKGERQIFILSLYWAIIELSGQDIPFIIDTPYARIDANHRKEISEKFLMN